MMMETRMKINLEEYVKFIICGTGQTLSAFQGCVN